MSQRYGAEKNCIHYAEHGAVGADAEHQCRENQKAHPRPLAHEPEAESDVLYERVHFMTPRKTMRARASQKSHAQERSEEHTSELQSPDHLVCRLLLEKKKIH